MAMVDFSLGDVGSLFTNLREAITGEKITDPNLKLELLKELQNAEAKMMQSKASVIVAEASSEHWLTSTWRPATMWIFALIIFNNYVLFPYASAFGLAIPHLPIPDNMWSLIEIGMGGYIVGRSAEKAVKIYKSTE
jgi:hypothetical protein